MRPEFSHPQSPIVSPQPQGAPAALVFRPPSNERPA